MRVVRSRVALLCGACLSVLAAPALAQAPETQSKVEPAPAQDAVNESSGEANNPGPGNSPATQAAEQQTPTGVEEIVVTAQFREQNLQDTPIAITAMSGAMLEARSQTNVSEVANQAPSVTLKPQGAAFGPSLGASIRGIGQFDFNPALEPGVGVYVDDVYYATLTGSIFDLLDLERVEILRGPQGTLAGKNSIGGAVKLYSKRPTGDGSGFVQAAYGSRDRLDLRGSIDFGLTDTIAMRLAGVAKKQEGYVKRLDFGCVNPPGSALNPGIPPILAASSDCVLAREGEVDYNAVRGQLRWQPTDNLDFNIIADYTRDDRTVAGSVLLDRSFNGVRVTPAYDTRTRFDIDPFTPNTLPPSARIPLDERFVCGNYCNYATYISPADANRPFNQVNGRTDFTSWGVSGQLDWDLTDDLQLVSITSYREYESKFSNDDDLSPLAHSLGRGDLTFWSVSQELRLNGSLLDDRIEYTLGGFYMDQRSVYTSVQDLRYAGLPPFLQDDPVNADTKALFAHLAYRPIDPLTLTLGLRYTDEHKDYTFVRVTPAGGPHPVLGALNGLTGVYDGPESDRFDYRLNAQYEFTPDISAYVQWSTGFKGGGISPRPFFAAQVLPFGPETLESWEVGAKSDLFDRMLRVNVALFHSDYKDIQLSLNYCPQVGEAFARPCALIVNGGDARVRGFELETSFRPLEGAIIDGALSYLDFDYKASTLAPNTGINPSWRSIYTPSWKWSVGAQYEVPLGNAGSITPRFDMAFQDDIYTNAVNRVTNRIEDYILANARLTWRNADEDLEISAEVTNLFDKYYHLTLFDLTIAGAGIATAQPGRPREWAISVKKTF